MILTHARRPELRRWSPRIRGDIVTPPCRDRARPILNPAPGDGTTPRPDEVNVMAGSRGIRCAHRPPCVGRGIVATSGVQVRARTGAATPHQHLAACPNRCMIGPSLGRPDRVHGPPEIPAWVIQAAGVLIWRHGGPPSPHDHPFPGPDGGMAVPSGR